LTSTAIGYTVSYGSSYFHYVVIKNLLPNTVYQYQIQADPAAAQYVGKTDVCLVTSALTQGGIVCPKGNGFGSDASSVMTFKTSRSAGDMSPYRIFVVGDW
jgi:hypothetical protein